VDRLPTVALVAAGGALGAVARWLLSGLLPRAEGRFPWGTFVVNVTGCLLIGFLLALLDDREPAGRAWRALLVVGFLGAYTTFSTFGWETSDLVRGDAWGRAAAYAGGSVLFGFAAVRLGALAARAFA